MAETAEIFSFFLLDQSYYYNISFHFVLFFCFFFEQWNNFSLKIDDYYSLETKKSLKAAEEINKGNSSTQT
jgi:hypothetical protein